MQLVLLEKHLLSKKNFVIAVDQVDRFGEDVVTLALSKHEVEQLLNQQMTVAFQVLQS